MITFLLNSFEWKLKERDFPSIQVLALYTEKVSYHLYVSLSMVVKLPAK